jgi:hypothetical protein
MGPDSNAGFAVCAAGRQPDRYAATGGGKRVKISKVKGYFIKDVPVTPPPFRDVPNKESKCLVEVRTDEGLVGWGQCGHAHPSVVQFING